MISNAAFSRFRSTKIPMPAVPVSELITETIPQGAFVVCGSGDIRVSWARTVTPNSLENATTDDLVLVNVGI